MTAYLLDVNVLVALLDPTHIHHERAHGWFAGGAQDDWLTVPLTENGVIRIVSHPSYSNTQPTPVVVESLQSLCQLAGHRFAPDSVSILDSRIGPLLSSSQVTDAYLVSLAKSLGVRLATFDRKIAARLVEGAEGVLIQIR